MDAVTGAAREGRPPSAETLAALGLPIDFVHLFIERLGYLLKLRRPASCARRSLRRPQRGDLRRNVVDEREARRILEDDPLYQAGSSNTTSWYGGGTPYFRSGDGAAASRLKLLCRIDGILQSAWRGVEPWPIQT